MRRENMEKGARDEKNGALECVGIASDVGNISAWRRVRWHINSICFASESFEGLTLA